jgi:hypothetical protein
MRRPAVLPLLALALTGSVLPAHASVVTDILLRQAVTATCVADPGTPYCDVALSSTTPSACQESQTVFCTVDPVTFHLTQSRDCVYALSQPAPALVVRTRSQGDVQFRMVFGTYSEGTLVLLGYGVEHPGLLALATVGPAPTCAVGGTRTLQAQGAAVIAQP